MFKNVHWSLDMSIFYISCVSCNLKPLNCPTFSLIYGLNGAQVEAESPDWYSWWFLKNPLVQFIWGFLKWGYPKMDGLYWKILSKMDDLGVPLF